MANQAPPVLHARPGEPTVTDGRRSVGLLAAARRGHAGLYWFAAAMAVTAGVTVVGVAVDQRVLLGAPLWTKPLKFALSFGLYTLTLAWMLAHVRRGRRIASALGWVVVVTSAIEMVIITGQAARGHRSHFNADTALDSRLFSIMG
ncbi:MAG TPA: hypothetical protein VHS32_11470, partial [Streptosporangiaceae bacterium]|nr:hypothetical protein [Streptosporangiaceae bacterium]